MGVSEDATLVTQEKRKDAYCSPEERIFKNAGEKGKREIAKRQVQHHKNVVGVSILRAGGGPLFHRITTG